uniref:Uncharacterized protein n=1 Tax=Vitis vinifera TaxID=29760 RepID=F6HZ46_VITVI
MSHCSQLSVFLFKFNELTIEILYFSPTSLNFPLYKVGIIINWLLSVRKQNSDWQIDMLYFRVFCNFSNRIKIGKIIQSLRECKTRKKGIPNNTLTAKSFLRIFHHFFFLL